METYSLEEIKTIILSLNPLKRVKFISRRSFRSPPCCYNFCLNPLKRVKFISIISIINSGIGLIQRVSIPSNGSSLFQQFQKAVKEQVRLRVSIPSNGSSLFQSIPNKPVSIFPLKVSIPSNGSSLFQCTYI